MPFGLTNAPAVFQNFMNDVFSDFIGRFVVIYLDDILIFSTDKDSHVNHVRSVLTRLRENSLFVKQEKCTFLVQEISFLGFILSAEGFKMDPGKVQAIVEWVQPRDLRALQRFLGFANYYRKFIKGFSQIVRPLTDLTRKGADLKVWPPTAENAFRRLKECFMSAPVLMQPDLSKPFIVEVDASEVGIGAVLSQGPITLTNLRPCAFFSRKFSSAERNYDVGNRELLAVKLAFEEWRHFLEGAAHRITVVTDHKNLAYIESAKRLTPRQARWALFFSRFNFSITFRPGSKNVKADALSRSLHSVSVPEPPSSILPQGVVVAILSTELETQVREAQSAAPASVPEGRLFVPIHLRLQVLQEFHNSVLSGHPGISATRKAVARQFWWPSMHADVAAFVSACVTCARAKAPRNRPAGELVPLPVPERPWTHLSMDFITDLPSSHGKTVVWVIVDRFSKQAHFVPLARLPNAETLSSLFIEQVVRLHGIPRSIVSDRGVQFVSKFWRAFCKRLGIELTFSSAYHPESNGQTERTNQTLEQILRCLITSQQEEWDSWLPLAEFSFNSRVNQATGTTPFFCNYGFHPHFGAYSRLESGCPGADSAINRLGKIWREVQRNIGVAQGRYKRFADRRRSVGSDFRVGDKVWLSTRNIRLKVPSPKLGPKFIGPYEIMEVVNPVAFRLQLPPSLRLPNVFHKSLLKPFSPAMGDSPSPPSPVEVEGEAEYEVERVINSRRVRGSLQYLIHWKGYGPEDRSWVPARLVRADRLVRAFHRKFPGRPGGPEDPP